MSYAGVSHEIYDAQTQAWLAKQGITATSFDGSNAQKALIDKALSDLNAALTAGQPMDPDEAHFLSDYFDNDGGDNSDFMQKFLYSTNYNTGDGDDTNQVHKYYNPNDESRVQVFIDSGLPLDPGLAVLLCNKELVYPTADPGATSYFKYYLNSYLINCGSAPATGSPIPAGDGVPPALLISTMAAVGGNVVLDPNANKSDPNTGLGPLMNKDKARSYAQGWMLYLASSGQPIDQTLIDAYVGTDTAKGAKWIGTTLSANLATDGTFTPGFAQLMQTYFQLDPTGSGTGETVTGTPTAPPYDSTPPTISGWSWLALQQLTRSVDSDRPMDPALLQQLDTTCPWAGTYARWYALNAQASQGSTLDAGMLGTLKSTEPPAALDVCETALDGEIKAHQSLNPTYLSIVVSLDPAAARDLCTRALQDALQPTNRMIAPDGSTDADNAMSSTTDATPTVRVDLHGMGTTLPQAGDTLTLMAKSDSGTTLTPVTYVLQPNDINQGFVDLATPTLIEGGYTITTYFDHPATANPSTAAFTSPASTPLKLTMDGQAPTIGNARWQADVLVMTITENGGAGLDGDSVPSTDSFTVTDGSGDVEVLGVTVDAVHGTVSLKLGKTPTGTVTVSYKKPSSGRQLQDRAGNPMDDQAAKTADPATTNAPLWDCTDSTLPLPAPPRALEMTAWNALNSLDPSLARQIKSQFAQAGLLPAVDPTNTPTPLDLSTMDLETALWTVFTGRAQAVEEQLRAQIQIVQQKNDAMNQLNGLLTALNAMDAAMPSGAKSDANVAKSVGDAKWADLSQQINSAIDQVSAGTNLKLFTTADGKISKDTPYNELKIAIQQVKGQVDSLGTNQQSETLRLQSLTSKRNECYDLISTHTQKIGDVRSRIIQAIV